MNWLIFWIVLYLIVLIFIPGILTDTEIFSKLRELPREMLNGTQLGIVFLVGTPIFLSWSVLARMDIWQRMLAALMSSGDSFLNIISISAVKDFVGWGSSTPVSPEKVHWMIKIATFVFGIIALFTALVFPNIVDLMVVGISTITIFAPITLFALIKKNAFAYRKAVLTSLLVAFFVNFFFFILGINHPESFNPKSSFVPAIIIETIILLIGIKLTNIPETVTKSV